MTSPLDTLDIAVVYRDEVGHPDSLFPANRISGTVAFQEETREKRWYGASSMDEVADIYLKTLVRNWPPTIVDETLSNPDNMGNTHRPSELGEGEFNTRKHPISLNAGRLHDMGTAGRIAKGESNQHSKNAKRYRQFVFQQTATLVHECGHLFITFIARDGTLTPSQLTGREGGSRGGNVGEAGAHLEWLLFGGIVMAARNPNDDDGQAGDPVLLGSDEILRTISQETVDKFVRYEFEFPLPTSGVVDKTIKQTLGADLPKPENMSDPNHWPEFAQLIAIHDRWGTSRTPFDLDELARLLKT